MPHYLGHKTMPRYKTFLLIKPGFFGKFCDRGGAGVKAGIFKGVFQFGSKHVKITSE